MPNSAHICPPRRDMCPQRRVRAQDGATDTQLGTGARNGALSVPITAPSMADTALKTETKRNETKRNETGCGGATSGAAATRSWGERKRRPASAAEAEASEAGAGVRPCKGMRRAELEFARLPKWESAHFARLSRASSHLRERSCTAAASLALPAARAAAPALSEHRHARLDTIAHAACA